MNISTLLFVTALAAQTPQQTYFEWTTLPFPASEYETRRDRLITELRGIGGGVFLVPSGDGVSHGDTFRPNDDFIFFTGLEFPNSVLVIDGGSGESVVYAPRRDPRFESASRPNDFPGRPLADDPAIAVQARIAIRPYEEFESVIAPPDRRRRRFLVNPGRSGPITYVETGVIHRWSDIDGLVAHLQRVARGAAVVNAYDAVARVRMIKSPREIDLMRRTARITMDAIRHATTFIKEGVDERTLEAELEAAYKRSGSQRSAFSSIIKSGPNSLWPWRVLASHYNRRNREMVAGDLVIFDVGAELDYYVSDVGRTFPVSGRFTDLQRAILTMEVAVSDAIIAAIKPGVTFGDLRQIAMRAIPAEHRRHMQAALFFGHHLGLDTGDPNLQDIPLAPGMIFTVEPWYYNHDVGISVFTEDEVLVTEDGVEVLTADLPRSPSELEARVGNRGGGEP